MVKLVDVRTELMGGDMLTKAVGPAVLVVNVRLIGMAKSGWADHIRRVCWNPVTRL